MAHQSDMYSLIQRIYQGTAPGVGGVCLNGTQLNAIGNWYSFATWRGYSVWGSPANCPQFSILHTISNSPSIYELDSSNINGSYGNSSDTWYTYCVNCNCACCCANCNCCCANCNCNK